jgi:catechol 2,3-dioxygenase-like lactoylglutathione lyase family enzyme
MARGELHHVEMYVDDLKQSQEFWEWFLLDLGYEKFQSWDMGVSWKFGNTYLVFVQTEDKYRDVKYHRCRSGLNHLAFHAKSRQDVDEMLEKLKVKNVPLLYQEKYPYAGGENYYAVFFEDPQRMKVEFVAPE